MLVIKSWFYEAGCEYVGMERKGSLFIYKARKPQISIPYYSMVLQSSKRNIPRIKIVTL
jgi:hypothetical protein